MRINLGALLLLTTSLSYSQPGVLDASFGNGGVVLTKILENDVPGFDFNRSNAVAATNNRIYLAGFSSSFTEKGLSITAYSLDGVLDPTFDDDGKKLINGDATALDVITQSDGKIIVGGFNTDDFFLIRLNTNGTLDSSWGGTGIVETDLTGTWERITTLALQSDGKVIAGGYSGTNVNDLTVARYTTTGMLDTTFGSDGFLNIDLQVGGSERIEGMSIQSDDKILLAGTTSSSTTGDDGFIMRLTKDGLYDNNFNGEGYVIVDFGGTESLSDVVVQPDNKIIASGVKIQGTSGVYRFNANGSYDTTFGVSGFADTNISMWSASIGYHIPSSKIVVFGYTYGAPSRDFAIYSFDTSGQKDICFGTNALARLDIDNSSQDYAYKGVIQPDGKLLIAGESRNSEAFVVARYIAPSPSIDKTVTIIGSTFTATEAGAQYSWIDCSTNLPINGATSKSYTATKAGNYKVEITKYGCKVTSSCIKNNIETNYADLADNVLLNTKGPSLGHAWGDYNGDGYDDLFVVNYAGYESFLFKNNGNKTFSRITNDPVALTKGDSYAGSWGDYDNDGLLDLFVGNYSGANSLFRNKNGTVFEKIASGVLATDATNLWDACWVDYNNDGLLDLFQATNNKNYLYKNLGNGQFQKIVAGNIVTDSEASFSCAWGDYNNDGKIDLFVANFGNQNNSLYKNLGDGTFQKITAGSIVNDGGQSRSASWGDYNNDGFLDLYVTNSGQKNFLYKNNGDETFIKISNDPVVNQSNWSYSSTWTDYDNDGYIDLAVSRSTDTDSVSLFKNNQNGSFTRIFDTSLIATGTFSWSISASDFDNNGYEDLYVAGRGFNRGYLFENKNSGNNFIGIALMGTISNKAGIGAKVKVKSNGFWQTKQVSGNTGRASQGSLRLTFGLGKSNTIDSIVVLWPGNKSQILKNITVNQILQIHECEPNAKIYSTEVICWGQSFEFGSSVLTQSGQYTRKFINESGCELTAVLDLIVTPDYSNLSVSRDICKGQQFQFGAGYVSEPGKYVYKYRAYKGCDSVVNLTLTVKSMNKTIIQSVNKLVAQETNALYQWVKCEGSKTVPVPGATESTFTPLEPGSYGLILNKNGCTETSDCISLVIVSADDSLQSIQVYPNPTSQKVIIQLPRQETYFYVRVHDVNGKLEEAQRIENKDNVEISLVSLQNGVYIIEIETDKGKLFAKVIKN
ncbi:MAG: T9SS type A sorting domain-containing protein [Cyclobacteriaceae bacterium]|nr:T9SS type A sorting domain-containing protein [Cyclobacteriaceae bacterium]